MAKFSKEDKLKAVNRYLTGKESSYEIGRSLKVDKQSILKWVKQYEYNGEKAFIKRYTSYTQQFKLDVLNYMTEQGTSLIETAAIFNIPAPSTIGTWRKQLETHGVDALRSKKKGRPSMKEKPNDRSGSKANKESTKALEERIKQLEMENEYLKKLNALVQNKEKSRNKIKRK